ncbi:hypothetical protein [Burkholderia guangdongensis]|uniref:hypothetical protein n=1 Tax=Burkholderia guangdongensis TaxID=1792500 RepID=UPI0015C7E618|nr:hypothetical protein [Burkholderia guangdongensis]
MRDACVLWGITGWQVALADDGPASAAASSATAGAPASQPGAAHAVPMGDGSRLAVMIGIAAMLVISWMIVIKTLRKQNWDLGLALSEEAALPDGTPPPAAGQRPPMVPSASRLIALMGLIVFSAFFIGVGFYVVWALCNGQPIDDANKAWTFFASGAAMFLPYGANKFADAFK